jgi:hypothetical protein
VVAAVVVAVLLDGKVATGSMMTSLVDVAVRRPQRGRESAEGWQCDILPSYEKG